MIEDKSVLDLAYKTVIEDDDSVVASVDNIVSRIKISTLKGLLNQWSNISNKPFENINSNYFSVSSSQLSLSSDVINKLHSHSNKPYIDKISEDSNGNMTYDGERISGASDWDDIDNKPFSSLSSDFVVSNNTLSISTDIKHTHLNKNVIDKFSEDDGILLYDGEPIASSGLDFSALSDSLTNGTLTGITITPNSSTETFDIAVTAMPTISINDNDEWTIDGVSTGHSSKGDNGLTPTINNSNKHWYIGETDTNVVAEGQDGYSPSVVLTEVSDGVEIEVVNKTGATTATVLNGTTTIQTEKLDLTATIPASGWNNTLPYTQTISVAGINENLNPRVDVLVSDNIATGNSELESWSYITRATTGNGIMTFYCYKNKPTVDLNIMIEVI